MRMPYLLHEASTTTMTELNMPSRPSPPLHLERLRRQNQTTSVLPALKLGSTAMIFNLRHVDYRCPEIESRAPHHFKSTINRALSRGIVGKGTYVCSKTFLPTPQEQAALCIHTHIQSKARNTTYVPSCAHRDAISALQLLLPNQVRCFSLSLPGPAVDPINAAICTLKKALSVRYAYLSISEDVELRQYPFFSTTLTRM